MAWAQSQRNSFSHDVCSRLRLQKLQDISIAGVSVEVLTDFFETLNLCFSHQMTDSTWSNLIFSYNFRMCHIFCQVWFPLCKAVFAAVEMGIVPGETQRKLIEKHWKRDNLSIGNLVINFLGSNYWNYWGQLETGESNQQFVQLL